MQEEREGEQGIEKQRNLGVQADFNLPMSFCNTTVLCDLV